MKTILYAVVTAVSLAGTAIAQPAASTDPVVQSRAKLNDAKRASDAAVAEAKATLSQANAKAKTELAADKKDNAAKAQKATAEGKDGLVVQRELDSKSNAAYKEKLKAAQATYTASKKAATDKMGATKAVEYSKIEKQVKP